MSDKRLQNLQVEDDSSGRKISKSQQNTDTHNRKEKKGKGQKKNRKIMGKRRSQTHGLKTKTLLERPPTILTPPSSTSGTATPFAPGHERHNLETRSELRILVEQNNVDGESKMRVIETASLQRQSDMGTVKKDISDRNVSRGMQGATVLGKEVHCGKSSADGRVALSLIKSTDYGLVDEPAFRALGDTSGFTVVGAIGHPLSGKSTILNELANRMDRSACPTDRVFRDERKSAAFRRLDQADAVSFYVTNNRYILLECGRLQKRRVQLDERPTSRAHHQRQHSKRHGVKTFKGSGRRMQRVIEGSSWIDLPPEMQLALLMLSVCHVVLVVMNSVNDHKTLDFVKQALSLHRKFSMEQHHGALGAMQGISLQTDSSGLQSARATGTQEATNGTDQEIAPPLYVPELVFIFNKTPAKDMTPRSYCDVQRMLNHRFQGCKFRKNGFVHPSALGCHRLLLCDNTLAKFAIGINGIKSSIDNVNYFTLPRHFKGKEGVLDDSDTAQTVVFSDCCDVLADLLLRMPKLRIPRTLLPTTPSARAGSNLLPHYQATLTEREWLRYFARTWSRCVSPWVVVVVIVGTEFDSFCSPDSFPP